MMFLLAKCTVIKYIMPGPRAKTHLTLFSVTKTEEIVSGSYLKSMVHRQCSCRLDVSTIKIKHPAFKEQVSSTLDFNKLMKNL
jgi:hypothetical protein